MRPLPFHHVSVRSSAPPTSSVLLLDPLCLSLLSLAFMNLPVFFPFFSFLDLPIWFLARGRVAGEGRAGLKRLTPGHWRGLAALNSHFFSPPGLVPRGDWPPHPVCGLCVEELGAAEGR